MPVFSRFSRYFIAVAQHGSIRRAAEATGISASSIDRQILLGEERLGATLFERLPSGLRLTAAGEMLLVQARRWEREFDDCRTRMDDLKGLRRGHVTLLIPEAMARGLVPRVIADLRVRHPGITLGVRVMTNHEIAPALLEGEGDLALVFDPVASHRLAIRASVDCPVGFVLPPGHALSVQRAARFSLCNAYPVISPAPPLAVAQKLLWLAEETGLVLNPVCESDDIETIKALIRHGVGISLLSSIDVVEEVREGTLVFVPLDHRRIHNFTLGFCVDQARSLPVAARLVAQALEAGLPELALSRSGRVSGEA
ncbi:LysR family transcriptional regulator [Asaia lannensis]|uniref:LysR family transcriptional regulator n=1 Tax=Asaia lannensis NBRC 102526 TaxID=1307926 RepID=A0ABT1CJ45_9PROT|nr:LysR family transcriptional regulator [Asaia lannensis]MCO6160862.1 LysR family transcriptional regulator [Asaia lannensis NBRC 102526]GBR01449.1 LysR family transcriptional regulator [Asaia lannensis NBRC 102526]